MATALSGVRRTIVIADDDADVALALARAVRGMGEHQVHVAYDGLEALELLRTHAVDLLLSDIDMPGMNGVELAAIARSEGLAPLRILLTGNARLDSALAAVNRGEVFRYLTKPWDPDELVRTLDSALLRLGELMRLSAADRAAERLRAACIALEAEFPGLTAVRREDDKYVVEPGEMEGAVATMPQSALALILRERSRGV
jgi:CheY-like chemotaxis protein